MNKILSIVIALAAVLFASIGLRWLVAPEGVATEFGMTNIFCTVAQRKDCLFQKLLPPIVQVHLTYIQQSCARSYPTLFHLSLIHISEPTRPY